MIEIKVEELADYITGKLLNQGIVVKKKDILKVLDLEDDFLRLKGVITDELNSLNEFKHFNILCSIDGIDPNIDEDIYFGPIQLDCFAVRVKANNGNAAEEIVFEKLKEIEKEFLSVFPTIYALSSYPTSLDEEDSVIEIEHLSVDSILSISPYLQRLNSKKE